MVAPLSTNERQQALQMCHIHTYDDVMYMYIYIYIIDTCISLTAVEVICIFILYTVVIK